MKKSKRKILIICDYYLPGYKSGGGMRTIVNMVARMENKFDFWIITRDHDGRLDREPYSSVEINKWNDAGNAQVFYLSENNVNILKIRELILKVKPNSIYANSYFSTLAIYALILRKLRLIPDISFVLAPCGELSDGALRLKASKKRVFITFSKTLGLYKNIIWKASTDLESKEIEKIKGNKENIYVAADMPPRVIYEEYRQNLKPHKEAGYARMIFLARFYPKKNFKWLLKLLNKIEGNLAIDIYGPLEDTNYWNECQKIIKTLPHNVKVESKGSVPHEKASDILFQYHFFILPTLGENFGHVFLEALAAGCPLIISNKTPWLDLERKEIGWDLPLENPEEWINVINQCVQMSSGEYLKLSSTARSFALHWLNDPIIEESTLRILEKSLRIG